MADLSTQSDAWKIAGADLGFFLKNENLNLSEIKDKPLTNGRFNPPKTGSRGGSQNMPQNDAKRLINGRFIDPIRQAGSHGCWPRIFV